MENMGFHGEIHENRENAACHLNTKSDIASREDGVCM
jgi:hypothetical protein